MPKTGGTYFTENLIFKNIDKIDGLGHSFYENQLCLGWKSWEDPNKMNKYYEFKSYKNRINPEDYLVSIIRNPFDLFVSYYSHNLGSNHSGWANCNNVLNINSFEEFIYKYFDADTEWHIPATKNNFFYWIYDKENLVTNRLLRFENLDNEIKKLSDDFDMNFTPSKKLNSSNRKDYKNYYTSDMVDVVYNNIGDMLEKHKYAYEI